MTTPIPLKPKLKIKLKPLVKKYLVVDLFAGTGAFTSAFHHFPGKFESVLANDMCQHSKNIYELNHPHTKFVLGDLNDLDVKEIPRHDILCAGFPCQPFSIAGQQKGFADPRSNVFWKIIEILKHHQPRIIILENVKNLKSHDDGHTYQTVISNLRSIGYHTHDKILDTSQITGVPHHRERIYIVGFKYSADYDSFDLHFPTIKNLDIPSFLENKVDQKYYYTDKLKVYDQVKTSVVKPVTTNTVYQYRRHYVRENKSSCCPTLTANMGQGGHNVPIILDADGIRKLTPRECFNLQGFDSFYQLPKISDSSLYRLAGNAVSVPVVMKIVEKLINILP